MIECNDYRGNIYVEKPCTEVKAGDELMIWLSDATFRARVTGWEDKEIDIPGVVKTTHRVFKVTGVPFFITARETTAWIDEKDVAVFLRKSTTEDFGKEFGGNW